MHCIRLHRIAIADAEELMAETWNCLEVYEIPSPRMAFSFEGQEHVGIEMSFREALWADIVERRLSRWRVDRAIVAQAAKGSGSKRRPEDIVLWEHATVGRRRHDGATLSHGHAVIGRER